jgi:hypothetical protein
MSRFEKIIPQPIHEITRDPATGLEWQAVPFAESMTWAEAEKACSELRLGGHADWRMPTRIELLSIVDDTRHKPAIDTDAFPETPSAWFWTSTPYAANPAEYAWVVYFGSGGSYDGLRGYRYRVRAVRGPSRQ